MSLQAKYDLYCPLLVWLSLLLPLSRSTQPRTAKSNPSWTTWNYQKRQIPLKCPPISEIQGFDIPLMQSTIHNIQISLNLNIYEQISCTYRLSGACPNHQHRRSRPNIQNRTQGKHPHFLLTCHPQTPKPTTLIRRFVHTGWPHHRLALPTTNHRYRSGQWNSSILPHRWQPVGRNLQIKYIVAGVKRVSYSLLSVRLCFLAPNIHKRCALASDGA